MNFKLNTNNTNLPSVNGFWSSVDGITITRVIQYLMKVHFFPHLQINLGKVGVVYINSNLCPSLHQRENFWITIIT